MFEINILQVLQIRKYLIDFSQYLFHQGEHNFHQHLFLMISRNSQIHYEHLLQELGVEPERNHGMKMAYHL